MEGLKRSEKLCPNCKTKNAIRCFNCKSCNFTFPTKEKKEKEKNNKPASDNKKIDEFWKFASKPKDNSKNSHISKNNNFSKNLNDLLMQEDGIFISEPTPINENVRDCENNKNFGSISNIINSQKFGEQNFNNFLYDVFESVNEKEHEKKSTNYTFLESDLDLENKIIIEKNVYDNSTHDLKINFENFDLGKNYSCDFILEKNNNILGVIAYFESKLNKIILSCINIEYNINKIFSSEKDSVKNARNSILEINSIKSIIPENQPHLNSENDIINFSVKFIKKTQLILFSLNNNLSLCLYNSKLNKISILANLNLESFVNKFDAIIISQEKITNIPNNKKSHSQESHIKIIISDYDNKIYLYSYSVKSCEFNLISVYEKYFNYKITDLKFLPFTEKIHNKTKYFFGACSRDGTLKIFDTFNPNKIVFSHRSTELWITKFFYDRKNDILFYLVNSNLTERVVSIKLFNTQQNKDYSVKRIPETEYCINCHIDEELDRCYLLKGDGIIKYLDSNSIVDMHLFHRSKKLKIIHKDIYKFGNRDKNLDEKNIKLNEIKISPEEEKDSTLPSNLDPLDYYSQFFIFNFFEENPSQIIIIPSLNKIILKILPLEGKE
jgi:hypothetical protein